MHALPVILFQSDPGTVESLIACLHKSFRSIRQSPSMNDLRNYLGENPEGIVILDMEIASTLDLQRLSHEFPGVWIICNHRLADEEMWTATLSAGAADCVPSYDTRGILQAALQHQAVARMAA